MSARTPARKNRVELARNGAGRFVPREGPAPLVQEVATVQKVDSLGPIRGFGIEYPNPSAIIQHRAEGKGLGLYDLMLATDSDLSGAASTLFDDVLHYPREVQAASDSPEHVLHARFLDFALDSIPHFQNACRNFLDSYLRGFSVTERMPIVVEQGEWRGAVIYEDLLDKPQRWFSFDIERRLRLRTQRDQDPGELVDAEKFIVMTYGTNSNPWGKPVLDDCYWIWFVKKHLVEMRAIWYEKWAQPTPIAGYAWSPSGTKTNQANMEEALRVLMSIMRENAVAKPKDMEVDLLESGRNGSVSFDAAIGQCTEAEFRRITGQVLGSIIGDSGSYAQAKVHATQQSNKVEMLGDFLGRGVSRHVGRPLIDRNFGPQSAYPRVRWLCKSPLELQAFAVVEQMQMSNGHEVSKGASAKRAQIVGPTGPDDVLTPSLINKSGQAMSVNPQLAAADPAKVSLAANRELYDEAATAAAATRRKLDRIAADAAGAARPAIKKIVAGFASKIREKKSLKGVTRAALLKGMRSGMGSMGKVCERMLDKADAVDIAQMAEGDAPNISDAAKIGLALLTLQILERIIQAAQDAPEEMDPGAFADSLTDPDGVAVDETFGNLFEGTHDTDIASIHAANLRQHLASPAFRAQFPYVMIVTQPGARLEHRLLNGYVMSAEDARFSDKIPPYDFGCRCVAVPLPAATAVRRGLTGAAPTGTLEQFIRDKGYGDLPFVGTQPGFLPAYSGTDARAQLALLRQKVEEIRRASPADWSVMHQWLVVLFGYDILTRDPDLNEEETAA